MEQYAKTSTNVLLIATIVTKMPNVQILTRLLNAHATRDSKITHLGPEQVAATKTNVPMKRINAANMLHVQISMAATSVIAFPPSMMSTTTVTTAIARSVTNSRLTVVPVCLVAMTLTNVTSSTIALKMLTVKTLMDHTSASVTKDL